jgi:hypothetical protein
MRTGCQIALAFVAGVLLAPAGRAQDHADRASWPSPREIGRTTERELKIVLSSKFGSVAIRKGEPEKIIIVNSKGGDDDPGISMDYTVRNRVGFLDLELGHPGEEDQRTNGSFRFASFERGSWVLLLNDAVPISFDVELGVGKGRFDLAGLLIRDFNLSTGASDVRVSFDRPNESSIENITIESGVSKFEGRNFGNANFKHLRFQGGVGAYVLDFSGALTGEVDVDAEVGFGILTMIMPSDVGARVFHEKSWVSDLDLPEDFTQTDDNIYTSGNYTSARGRINVRVDSGFGSIRIKRP